MPEGLREEEHALYFPIGDADACADALARVLTDTAETEARTARAFERARQFNFDNYMAQIEAFLSAVVNEHTRRGQPDRHSHLRRPAGSTARRPRSAT
jgi:glycosyltransferase involved in cell wall biosynthesis